jgi:hypothetical protein
MSNSEAEHSDTEGFYSPVNSSKTPESQNTKKRTRISTSSDSPSPELKKVEKHGDQNKSTLSANITDEAMQTFFKDLVLKSEE